MWVLSVLKGRFSIILGLERMIEKPELELELGKLDMLVEC